MSEPSPDTTRWKQRTVERSLQGARQRAITRGDKFIEAATELLRTTHKADFTVQEVVDRSGMSLRSFYHHFATKDDLLLALLEETVRQYVEAVRPAVDAEPDPTAKLRILLTRLFGSEESDDPASRGLVLFHWHLADARADDFAATIEPQLQIIREILELGVADGSFRDDISLPVLTTFVHNTLVSVLDMRVLGLHLTSESASADDLLAWIMAAVTRPSTSAD
jgi:AcrR family transcriptional regulator